MTSREVNCTKGHAAFQLDCPWCQIKLLAEIIAVRDAEIEKMRTDWATICAASEAMPESESAAVDRFMQLRSAAEEVLRIYMPQFPDSRAVDDCLVGLAAALTHSAGAK